MTTPLVAGIKVENLDRAAGCRPELLELLESWKLFGTFDLTVAVDGGYRHGRQAEAQQARLFAAGLSKAGTLRSTPHGRRCAVDVHPVGFMPNRSFQEQALPGMLEKFQEWGEFVEKSGLVWGGRFRGFGKYGDMPHAELPGWSTLYRFPSGLHVPQGATNA